MTHPDHRPDLADPVRHVEALVALCAEALNSGRLQEALRLSARGVRLFKELNSQTGQLNLLRASVLLVANRPKLAEKHFEIGISCSLRPDGDLGLVLAKLAQGQIREAHDLANNLFRQFSVVDFPILEGLAQRLGYPGWACPTGEGKAWIVILDRPGPPENRRLLLQARRSDGPERLDLSTLLQGSASRIHVPIPPGHFLDIAVDGHPVLGSPIAPLDVETIEGEVDYESDKITGWACLIGQPNAAIELLFGNETPYQAELALPKGQDRRYFDLDLPRSDLTGGVVHVKARLTGQTNSRELAGSPLWLELPAPPSGSGISAPSGQNPAPPHAAIDIIIPVFRGLADTMACLQSVIASSKGTRHKIRIVVIDDASPEPALTRELQDYARDERIVLLRHERNMGFPASVNDGFATSPEHDVVILNSDAVIHNDWLDRLVEAAYSASDIGTVSPLSNEATILSYPDPKGGNPPLDEAVAAELDALAAKVNEGALIDIPTGVGFCMYIKRACLEGVGVFDARLFARGYGEENDFCMRALALGWRHVAAPNIYVTHLGGRSFGQEKRALIRRNPLLNRRYPAYDQIIQDFETRDTLAPHRRRLDAARLKKSLAGRDPVLLVNMDLDGGAARFVEENAARHRDEGRAALCLRPKGQACELFDPFDKTIANLIYRLPDEMDQLIGVLAECRIAAVEFHHLMGHDQSVRRIPGLLGIPYDVYIHDYSWICPRITLMDGRGRYCGAPKDADICTRCIGLYDRADRSDEPVASLRRENTALFARANQVIAPAADVQRRYQEFMPSVLCQIRPWEAIEAGIAWPKLQSGERLKVAVIGAIGQHKGFDILLEIAREAEFRDLPIEFSLIGFSKDDTALFKTGRVFVTGRYEEDEAVDLIRAQGCHLAFLPSVWPETWCYALSRAWQSGLPVLAFDLGAPAERIRNTGNGWVMPVSTDPDKILSTLFSASGMAASDDARQTQLSINGPPKEKEHVMSDLRNLAGQELQASGTVLTFAPGLYSFSLGAPTMGGPFPAIQVIAGPGTPQEAHVEFLGNGGNWLAAPGDVLIAKISGAPVALLVNTFRLASQGPMPMPIECRRLDQPPAPAPALAPPPPPVPHVLRSQILAHVQNRGDIPFVGVDWAGCVGQRLWIEAFAIMPLEGLSAEDIEYKAVTADGQETPWITGGNLCGVRGNAMPITGFAVRLRGPKAQAFDCEYRGAFFSGGIVGPMRNGAPCRAADLRDPLEGIQLSIVQRTQVPSEFPSLPRI